MSAITAKQSAAKITSILTGLDKRLKSSKQDIQRAAVMITMHAVEHGDISHADKLCEIVKDAGLRNTALAKWFTDIGVAKIKTETVDGKAVKRFGVDAGKREAMAKAIADSSKVTVESKLMAKDWNSTIPKQDTYEGFDLDSLLRSLAKRADKALKEHGDDPKTKIDANKLAKLKAIYLFDNPEQTTPALHGTSIN